MSSTTRTDFMSAHGAEATSREISQQPDVWRELARDIERQRPDLDAFLAPLLALPTLRIVLTGAGTSAFVGNIAAPALSRALGRRVEAIATTDIVSNPREAFAEDVPTLLVSFARSGNSPESTAATDLADEVLGSIKHLIITCDATGTLFTNHNGRENSAVVLMPPQANDQGFAMTSSFTSMLLSCLVILGGRNDELLEALSTAATDALQSQQDVIRELAHGGFERVVYLGSGSLAGLARESALKLLELTAGKIVSYFDSALGFRHGPKSVLNDRTLVLVYVSSDAYTRQYDLDIIAELSRALPAQNLVVISSTPLEGVSGLREWIVPGLAEVEDAMLAVPYVVFAQLLALAFSVELGMTPDNPFPDGTVNRVVEGVRIHTLPGAVATS